MPSGHIPRIILKKSSGGRSRLDAQKGFLQWLRPLREWRAVNSRASYAFRNQMSYNFLLFYYLLHNFNAFRELCPPIRFIVEVMTPISY